MAENSSGREDQKISMRATVDKNYNPALADRMGSYLYCSTAVANVRSKIAHIPARNHQTEHVELDRNFIDKKGG
jgi:hypothetical protein